jgi:hypothetical protein
MTHKEAFELVDHQLLMQLDNNVRKAWQTLKSEVLSQPAYNSRYVTALEDSYGILNRMGGALEGCRAELAIVIEHLNAAK